MDFRELLAERFQVLELALLFSFLGCLVAWWKGFFFWPAPSQKGSILSSKAIIGAFALYFFCEFFIAPAAAGFWFFFTQGHIPPNADEVLSPDLQAWFNLLGVMVAAGALLLFCRALGSEEWSLVWNRGCEPPSPRIKSLFLGMSTWFLSYPFVLVMSQSMAIIALYIYQRELPPLEQTAVTYLKGLMDNPLLFWLTSCAIIIVVPMAEELLFRGFLQTWMQSFLGRTKAIFWVCLLFAFLHFSPDQGLENWELLSALFILSCFLGFIYERQRSLWAPIGLHAVFNGISIFMILHAE